MALSSGLDDYMALHAVIQATVYVKERFTSSTARGLAMGDVPSREGMISDPLLGRLIL